MPKVYFCLGQTVVPTCARNKCLLYGSLLKSQRFSTVGIRGKRGKALKSSQTPCRNLNFPESEGKPAAIVQKDPIDLPHFFLGGCGGKYGDLWSLLFYVVQDYKGISSPLGNFFLPKCLLCFYFLISKLINTSYGIPSLYHEVSEALGSGLPTVWLQPKKNGFPGVC